jgi:hypothetical protein
MADKQIAPPYPLILFPSHLLATALRPLTIPYPSHPPCTLRLSGVAHGIDRTEFVVQKWPYVSHKSFCGSSMSLKTDPAPPRYSTARDKLWLRHAGHCRVSVPVVSLPDSATRGHWEWPPTSRHNGQRPRWQDRSTAQAYPNPDRMEEIGLHDSGRFRSSLLLLKKVPRFLLFQWDPKYKTPPSI